VDRDADDLEEIDDEHVSPGCGTPASVETPLQSSVSRCTSLNVIRDPLSQTPTRKTDNVISPVQVGNQPVVATTTAGGTAINTVATTTTATTTTSITNTTNTDVTTVVATEGEFKKKHTILYPFRKVFCSFT